MIHFRGLAFYTARCACTDCELRITEDVAAAAVGWWGGPRPPVSFADRGPDCTDFTPAGSGGRPDATPLPDPDMPAAATAGASSHKPETARV